MTSVARIRAVLLLGVALGTLGPGAVPTTHAAEGAVRTAAEYAADLENADKAIRREAAYQLSRMGKGARVALPQLIRALDDEQQYWFGGHRPGRSGARRRTRLARVAQGLESWQPFRKDRQGSQALYRTALALGSIGCSSGSRVVQCPDLRHVGGQGGRCARPGFHRGTSPSRRARSRPVAGG